MRYRSATSPQTFLKLATTRLLRVTVPMCSPRPRLPHHAVSGSSRRVSATGCEARVTKILTASQYNRYHQLARRHSTIWAILRVESGEERGELRVARPLFPTELRNINHLSAKKNPRRLLTAIS